MDHTRQDTGASRTVAVLAAAGIASSLTQTLVIPLIGSLPEIFSTSATNTSWIITVTLLTGAVSMPVLGRLADILGNGRMILVALVPLFVGSVLCALSTTLPLMVLGRALQGVANGITPLGISLLHDVLPAGKVGRAVALMSSSMGIGGALGLPLAATIAQLASWRILFWTMAAVSALILVLVASLVPADPVRGGHRGRFDPVGSLLLGAGLVCLLLFVSKGTTWGWGSPMTSGSALLALAVLASWVVWELHCDHALIDLRQMTRPVVLVTNLASVFIGFAMYAQSLIVPQLMQLPVSTGYGLGQSMLGMGLWMAPTGIAMMAVSGPGARLSARFGARTTLMTGGLVMALGYAAATLLMGSTWTLALSAALISAGVGLAFGAMPALIMGAVPADQKAAANAFNALMRSIGISVSSAVIAVVLATLSTATRSHAVVPTQTGFRVGLLVGAGVSVLAAVLARCIPTRGDLPSPAQEVARVIEEDEGGTAADAG